jgi:hypothetical protein
MPSRLIFVLNYNDPRDGHTEIENNIEIEEDHIDINLNSPPVVDVKDYF